MAHKPRGIESLICMKPTATFAEASGGTGWKNINLYSETFDPGEGVTDDPELGSPDDENLTDPQQGMPTRPNPQGNIQTALDLNQIGYFLSLLLGPPVTEDADDPVFEHVWKTGGLAPGFAHFQIRQAAAIFKMADAWTASAMSFNMAPEDGYRRIDWTMMGRSVRTTNATLAVSPAAAPTRQKIKGVTGKLQIGANLGALSDFSNVLGGTFNLASNATPEFYMNDSPWPGDVLIGERSCTVNPQLRFTADDYALISSWDGETPKALRFIFEKSADLRMQIDLPNVIANKKPPSAAGKGMMEMTPTFLASKSASGPMCTITIRNQVASYAIA